MPSEEVGGYAGQQQFGMVLDMIELERAAVDAAILQSFRDQAFAPQIFSSVETEYVGYRRNSPK